MSSSATNNLPKERERFAAPMAICGLIGAGLLLLTMLYPEKSLLMLLSAPEVTTPAQQRYLEILVKVRTGEPELVFTLTRSYLAAGIPDRALKSLEALRGDLTPLQTKTALELGYEARRQTLKASPPDTERRIAALKLYADQVDRLIHAGATPADVARYAADARRIGDKETTARLEQMLRKSVAADLQTPVQTAPDETTAEGAIARGDYRRAAAIHFQEMQSAPRGDKRKFFMAAVRVLQSGNLLEEALVQAEGHLDPLKNDRQTLMFLTRLALAANRPERAQDFMRRALDITGADRGGG